MKTMTRTSYRAVSAVMACASVVALALVTPTKASADIAVQSGQSVAFLGDSITAQGWSKPTGYVKLVVAGLATNGVKVTAVPAGISGHKSNDMLARLDKDVLSKKPNWMTLSCGVNDVWHGERGVPLEAYKTNITAIVDQALAANVKVIILTSTPIGEDLPNANNVKLADYNAFLRDLAKQKGCAVADLNADFAAAIGKKTVKGNAFTVDGVHMNPAGDFIMASGVLRAMGVDNAGIEKAKAAWMDTPNGASVAVTIPMTPRQWFALQDTAAAQGKDVPTFISTQATAALNLMPAK
ncbi:MAG TPA: SGNH/GDSL hydrolase family protein [Capsulimonadaceae bacterium]|jgi:lysophospholipase L1-like esterase